MRGSLGVTVRQSTLKHIRARAEAVTDWPLTRCDDPSCSATHRRVGCAGESGCVVADILQGMLPDQHQSSPRLLRDLRRDPGIRESDIASELGIDVRSACFIRTLAPAMLTAAPEIHHRNVGPCNPRRSFLTNASR